MGWFAARCYKENWIVSSQEQIESRLTENATSWACDPISSILSDIQSWHTPHIFGGREDQRLGIDPVTIDTSEE